MAFYKKHITSIILLICLSSCSTFISEFGLTSKYIEKNKGKENYICVYAVLPKDTLYAIEDSIVTISVYLKNCGNSSYFFDHRPFSGRKDWGIYKPNSIYRAFFHNDEKCKVINGDEYVMHDERDLKFEQHFLHPGQSFYYRFDENIHNINSDKSNRITENNEYGEYKFQVIFITELYDTIQSDYTSFWYLEKYE